MAMKRDGKKVYTIGDSSPRAAKVAVLRRIKGKANPPGRSVRFWGNEIDIADGDIPLLLDMQWCKKMGSAIDFEREEICP